MYAPLHACPRYNMAWGLQLNIFLERNELCTVMKVFEMDLTVTWYKKSQIKVCGQPADTWALTGAGLGMPAERRAGGCDG